MISELDVVLRITAAAILGGLVGFERERHNQPAGLRTHTILAVGSALAMCLSIEIAMQFRDLVPNGDPGRLAAQVISGIGFLGAGAIIRFGANIKGLTTATSLWTVAITGLAVGAGHFFSAAYATAVLLFILIVLDKWEKRVVIQTSTRFINIRAKDQDGFIDNVKKELAELRIELKALTFSKQIETNELQIKIIAKIRDRSSESLIIQQMSKIPGAKEIGVE